MYKSDIKILLAGCPEEVVRIVRAAKPLAAFTHDISEAPGADPGALSAFNLILLGPEIPLDRLSERRAEAPQAAFIALRSPEKSLPQEALDILSGVWPYPAPPELLAFYFREWQKQEKKDKDLWEKAQFLDSVLETSPNLIWFKTKDGIHELVNSCFCHTVGKAREDAQGKSHAYIWNVEADDPACVESERMVMESGQVHVNTEEIETGAGRKILTTFKAPLRDADGSMMGTMGIGVDITKERLYHSQLAKNNELLEAVLTSMECGVICHTLDGKRVISVNAAALRLLDYASLEDLEYSGFQMVAPTVLDEDKPKLKEAIGRLKNVGDRAGFEYRVRHSGGRILHIMGNARLVEREGRILCERFLLDCTDQKIQEKKERDKEERRQKELIRALAIDYQLVFVVDSKTEKGMILQLRMDPDPNLYDIFSDDEKFNDELSRYIQTCVHPDDREAFAIASSMPVLKGALKNSKICYFHYRVLNGDDVLYYQMKAVRAGEQESDYNIIIGFQSVNERMRQEMEQKAVLEKALHEAKKANIAKSIFLSNMSHDIRTPMNAVIGYTNLALTHLENKASVRSYLEKILSSGKHLISLINDILNMSYVESGHIHLDEKPLGLSALFKELWNIVQPAAEAKGHELLFETEGIQDWDIKADRLRLNQIFLNLLGNSVKYTPDGGKITLSARQLPCAGSGQAAYEFRVKDNGIGMSEDFLERIFDPFERAQSTTAAGVEGAGLGMAITKNIVDMLEGDIEVYSKPSEGTEFVFRAVFETAPGSGCEGDEALLSPAFEEKEPKARRPGRILLTEDNPMNQEIACEFLEGAGYEVDVAPNGREALAKLQKTGPGHYDVVLMDVQMPVMDGYEAAERIRRLADPELANVPIIAMTANSMEEDRAEALRRGMNGHIAKPIDFPLLFATLDEYMVSRA